MTTYKYLTGGFFQKSEIKRVEVEKETEHSVWINGRRSAKESRYGIYHDTYSEARHWIIKRAEAKAKYARENLEKALSSLNEALDLPESEP